MRLISRFLGYWLVASALVLSVVDGAKSIAASKLVTTPLAETLQTLAALGGGAEPARAQASAAPWPLDLALAGLLAAPTAALAAALGFLFLVAGRHRRRPAFSREYAT